MSDEPRVVCALCGEPIASLVTAWQEVTGYERHRRQGGTNHVALRRLTGRYACGACVSKLQSGVAVGQESLL